MAIVEKERLLCYLKGYSVSMKKEGKLMLASKMLEKLTYECVRGNVDKEITALVYDSRKIEKGCMFVCIAGANFDGHSCAGEAAEKPIYMAVAGAPAAAFQVVFQGGVLGGGSHGGGSGPF